MSENIINTKKLCEWLEISENTAYNWRKYNGLPYKKITKKTIQYDREEVINWLNKNSMPDDIL